MKYSELIRLLIKDDWYVVRQSGSHILMAHPQKKGKITISFHAGKEIKKGLLRNIIKQTGLKTNKR